MNRRRFASLFLGGSFVATLAAFLYPVIRYLIPPRQAEAVLKKVVAAKAGELAPNSSKIFKFGSSPALLVNTQEGELRAFSAICTHLACSIHYESDTATLFCPCHGGRFDLSGNVIAGPPPGPLESFKVEFAGDEILVSKKS
jgi:cytochrome b6-f complex iron-sulfur subunit